MLKKSYKYIVIALVLLVSVLGISYAFFEYYGTNKNSSLIFGNIYLKFTDGASSLSLTNVFPETKEEARKRTDNLLTFTLSGLNTTTNKDIWYEIILTEGNAISGKTRFNTEDLVFDLVEIDENNKETTLIDAGSFSDLNSKRIWVNTILRNVTTEINRTYKLRMWLSEDVTVSDTNPNATYKASEFKNKYASVKVAVFGNFVEKDVNTVGRINYYVDGLDIPTPPPTDVYANQAYITNDITSLNLEGFEGWSIVRGGEVKYLPGDIVPTNELPSNTLTLYPVIVRSLVSVIEEKLSFIDTITDIDGTRYLTGDNSTPNYLWYSGKLWRIVAINSDGTIKLVTQGNMTTIAWNTSRSTNYSTSQIRTWLNEEFLPTIETSVLVDSTWDYTTYASATATKVEPIAYVENEKVGLLTIYDYYKAGSSSSFLNNGYFWWTMSPRTDGSSVWDVSNSGSAYYRSQTDSRGVRPAVNLKSDIQIMGGAGTKSNPYVIGGDKDTGVTSELLSNRISGEYVNFNDVLYRIVGTEIINEQKLTKITMSDYSVNKNTIGSVAFGSSSSQRVYSPTYGIGLYLENWYQADSTSQTYATTYIKDNYKTMIATANDNKVVWYTGPTSGTGFDYSLSKTGTPISATIGLGYYGEMFSSQFGGGYNSSTDTGLMTIYSSSSYWGFNSDNNGGGGSPTTSSNFRPSMYLKSDVKIVSGSGMPNDPYEITM